MIPSWAKISAQVVCIDGTAMPNRDLINPLPPLKIALTITGFGRDPLGEVPVAVTIDGWPNCFKGEDLGWNIARFRPIHSLRSDIRMVKALVREMPASERLDRLVELLNEPEAP